MAAQAGGGSPGGRSIIDMLENFLSSDAYREARERFCRANCVRFFGHDSKQPSPDGGGEYTHAQYQIFELFRGHSEKLVTDRIPEAKLMSALRCAVARRDARGQDCLRRLSDGVEWPAFVALMKAARLELEKRDDPRLPAPNAKRLARVRREMKNPDEQLEGSDDDYDDMAFLEAEAACDCGSIDADASSSDDEALPGAVR